MPENPCAPSVAFTATGRDYTTPLNLLARQIPGTPDRIVVGLQTALRGAFAALYSAEADIDREFSASASIGENGSFNLSLIPGDIVAPEQAPAPADDPDVVGQEIARQKGQARGVKGKRERLGITT